MTNAPADLLAFRQTVMNTTGLTNPVEVGIVGDDAHGVGYHIGIQTIKNRGNYPSDDYSTRQTRDRVGGDDASAMDIGDDWPRGGRPAWIRFGNLVYAQLLGGDAALSPIRAINFSPDGSAKKRYDTLHRADGLINSADTVNIHTHLEFWRDTNGHRAACFARLKTIMEAAIANSSIAAAEAGADQMWTLFSASGDTSGAVFFGVPGGWCFWVRETALKNEIVSLGSPTAKWMDPVAPDHSAGAVLPISRGLINIVGPIPNGFLDRAVFPPEDTVPPMTLTDAQLQAIASSAASAVNAGLASTLTAWALSAEGKAALKTAAREGANEAEDS
jgi:hypothetical protein